MKTVLPIRARIRMKTAERPLPEKIRQKTTLLRNLRG